MIISAALQQKTQCCQGDSRRKHTELEIQHRKRLANLSRPAYESGFCCVRDPATNRVSVSTVHAIRLWTKGSSQIQIFSSASESPAAKVCYVPNYPRWKTLCKFWLASEVRCQSRREGHHRRTGANAGSTPKSVSFPWKADNFQQQKETTDGTH